MRPTTRSVPWSCLTACKMLAYGLSLSAFRGGPVFPAMFIGATVGIALSGLPGLSMAPAIAAGIGAMCAAMLRLPMTSALLATILLGSDGVAVTPQVVVAVVVSFVVTMLLPAPDPEGKELRAGSATQPTPCPDGSGLRHVSTRWSGATAGCVWSREPASSAWELPPAT